MGYNFQVGLFQKDFGVEADGESAKVIARIAEYITAVRDIIAEEMSKDFSDTPTWYWDKNSGINLEFV